MARLKWPSRRSQRIEFDIDEEVVREAEAEKRGIEAEDRVEQRLHSLMERGLVFFFVRADPEGELNHRFKADFVVWPEYDDWNVMLQVKSSEFGRLKHLAEYGISHMVRACVVYDPSDTDESLDEKILEELSLSVKHLKEIIESGGKLDEDDLLAETGSH